MRIRFDIRPVGNLPVAPLPDALSKSIARVEQEFTERLNELLKDE
jgi:hypothetical protein